ncbi:MAG: metallophosphoesterase [Prochloraceae cyanobacterium]|nr:metallophosphoesterase [Prochloraceae cyanobacterium]
MKLSRPPYWAIAAIVVVIIISSAIAVSNKKAKLTSTPTYITPMLSDPFLQLPSETSVRVVWFTDFPGSFHRVVYGEKLDRTTEAITTKLSRVREDPDSRTDRAYQEMKRRDIWRHEAIVTSLTESQPIPYRVISARNDRDNVKEIKSGVFTLAPKPQPGQPLKILLTSDHQLKPMTAANLQKVAETIGRVDAVFMAGDLVNIPDRASEWFDDTRGGAFFPCLQGRAKYELEKQGVKTVYTGGELIQHAPLFTAIGNHEVMGKFSDRRSLKQQFNDAIPRDKARTNYEEIAQQFNLGADPVVREAWVKANSFNSDTYEELFTLPQSIPGGKKYYAETFGDIRLVVLFVTNIWRPATRIRRAGSPNLGANVRGKYRESDLDLDRPEKWGYGQHIFEPIAKGSPQYSWLEKELESEEFKQAKYKIVMFHHPPHTLGENIVPPYTDPAAKIEYKNDGSILSLRYEYPPEKDYIIRDLLPLLESAGVQLVFYGHSHLWNRFVSHSGMHFLESSNVGNTYGAFTGEKQRDIPKNNSQFNYALTGDPNGLEPVLPNIAPLLDKNNRPSPYIASNDITVFSILDTGDSSVSSYRFDTRSPNSQVVKFDRFILDR